MNIIYKFVKNKTNSDFENIIAKKEIEELCFVINMNKEYHHHWDLPTKQGEDLKQVLQLQLLQPQLKKDTMCKTFNLITLILQFHGCLQLREDSKKDIRDDGDGKNNGDE